jgi:flagellar protein FliO/FliZ
MQTLTTLFRRSRPPGSRLLQLLCIVALLIPGWVLAADSRRTAFAAPAQFGGGGSGFGMLRVCLALVLVLATVYAAAWLMRRLRNGTASSAPGLMIVAQVSLGARERAVMLRVGQRHLLLGVAAGSVRLLQDVAIADESAGPRPTPGDKPSFRELLRRSVGR